MSAPRVRRNRFVLALARRYARRRLRRAFAGVWGNGLEAVRARAAETPLVVAANHVAWWDPFMVVLLDELLGTESYCLMDAANLARLPFFGWLGAVPLERRDARTSLADLRASAALADRPGRLLWIFPQGALRRAHLRPLGLQQGVRILARDTGLPVVPLALDYAFGEASRPLALASFGTPVTHAEAPGGRFVPALEARMVAELERIEHEVARPGDLVGGSSTFVPLLGRGAGRLPLGARLLTWLGGREARHA
ncbi:MAG: lysophospholipid acyltransferase family protein [Myxococcales bacterium]|nr:lysophospholipid acyltransferase family protein [Myxococcales bacterium]